jgi:hypothetical protein
MPLTCRSSALVLPSLLLASACGDVIVDETATSSAGAGATSASASTSASAGTGGAGSGGGGIAGGTQAVVVTSTDGTGPCALSPTMDPSDVFLLVASQPISCDATLAPGFSDPGCLPSPFVWELCFPLAPSQLVPGSFAFTETSNPLGSAEADSGGCSGSCCAGGESFPVSGTFTITAASASSVAFTLAGTSKNIGPGVIDADGSYVASICP